jgi:hypothetical protein
MQFMGPFTQMDKSTIQGLSFEEYTSLSRYYSHVITPILLRELSSMLAKKEEDLDDLKKKVSLLAAKSTFGPVHLIPSAEKLAYSNLMGEFVPMNGRLPIEGGTFCVTEDGSKGWVLDEPAEVTLLRNWGNNIFKEDDIEKGREHRKLDSEVDLDKLCKDVASDLIDFPKFKSLDELIYWIDDLFAKIGPEQLLLNAANFILRSEHIQPTLLRWKAKGCPALDIFAPYSIYFYKVNLFYILGINFELIKKGKKSKTHLDIQYIYYLPFSMIFTSGDKELRKIVPYFLRKNQSFISLSQMKNDSYLFENFFKTLSNEQLTEFYLEYGPYPPALQGCHTSKIWKKRMRPKPSKSGARPSAEEEKRILEEFKKIKSARPINH